MYSYVVLLWWKLHEQKGKRVRKYFLQKNHKSKFEDTHVIGD